MVKKDGHPVQWTNCTFSFSLVQGAGVRFLRNSHIEF
jgi:hypothetical protein